MQQRLDLIVGLGNPDPEYLLTRHNAGFWFVDALARSQGARFSREKKLLGETAEVEIAGTRVRLLKPQTYMNLSGQSVAAALAYYKIPPEHLLVAYDEIDLPAGRVRLKLGGGHAGHNGVRNVIEHVGPDFWRIRIGVGHPGRGRKEKVIGHVLNRASADEEQLILEGIGQALEILPVLIEQGGQRAQNRLHTLKPGSSDAGEAKEP
ncbi:MAG TPA: aminoacyl-tRNA hydrolase [Gammaproteobacteria bacterium]|nr:aminoacyl-tRNA hydrolase [Gammaproteobacteria bacterium]